MSYSTIVLFTYNRLRHTEQTVESLLKNAEACDSDLIVYSDGAKNKDEVNSVSDVRQYVHSIDGFKSVQMIERKENLGLARSIISGVTDVVNEYGMVIVLEDDMVTSPYFLKYMNDALNLYKNDDRVISIHGYSLPIEGLPETFFVKGADCWGWATWKRGWDLFEADGLKLLQGLDSAGLAERFDLYGGYPYRQMLLDQIQGKNDSWAVRWYASALLAGKLTLHPGRSMLLNIGTDGSGVHCAVDGGFDSEISKVPVQVGGIDIEENAEVLAAWQQFYNKSHKSFFAKMMSRIREQMKR